MIRIIFMLASISGISEWKLVLEAEQEDKIISHETLMTTDGPDKFYILVVYFIVDIYVIQIMVYCTARNTKSERIKTMIDFMRHYSAFN